MPDALSLLTGFAAGAAATAAGAWWRYERPLRRTARACQVRSSTDLSRTIPETGPAGLKTLARALNDVEADFQEVLLLFAHMARSARASADLLRPMADSGRRTADGRCVAEVIEDLDQMQATIRDFHYFRVSIDGGTIRDTSVVPSPATAPARPSDGERQ